MYFSCVFGGTGVFLGNAALWDTVIKGVRRFNWTLISTAPRYEWWVLILSVDYD